MRERVILIIPFEHEKVGMIRYLQVFVKVVILDVGYEPLRLRTWPDLVFGVFDAASAKVPGSPPKTHNNPRNRSFTSGDLDSDGR